MRNLILVQGNQLNADSDAFDGFDSDQDAVWMSEVTGEAKHVWSHKARIALFLSAMRHFRITNDSDLNTRYWTNDTGNRLLPPIARRVYLSLLIDNTPSATLASRSMVVTSCLVRMDQMLANANQPTAGRVSSQRSQRLVWY